MGYGSIAWLPLCAGLTVLGLVLSYLVGRRRGYLPAMRGAAWSLLPIAAYLTGSVEMFWKIGAAIGHYADGFAFSPVKWAGVGVAGLAALLFFTTSGRRRRAASRLARRTARGAGKRETAQSPAPGEVTSGAPGTTRDLDIAKILERPGARAPAARTRATPDKPPRPSKPAKAAAPDDDAMKDIEDILRKRGI